MRVRSSVLLTTSAVALACGGETASTGSGAPDEVDANDAAPTVDSGPPTDDCLAALPPRSPASSVGIDRARCGALQPWLAPPLFPNTTGLAYVAPTGEIVVVSTPPRQEVVQLHHLDADGASLGTTSLDWPESSNSRASYDSAIAIQSNGDLFLVAESRALVYCE